MKKKQHNMVYRWNDEESIRWRRSSGITPEIEEKVFDYERVHGGPVATRGLATRVFGAISKCGGVDQARTMTKRVLLSMNEVGRLTAEAMIDLGLGLGPKEIRKPRATALDRIDPAQIDFAVGVLRGVLGKDWLPDKRAHTLVEHSITHVQEAARLIERLQKTTERKRSK